MPANFIKGDLLDEAAQSTGPRAVVFGADCAGTMDAGVAVAIRKRWPALAEAYAAHAAGGKAMQLGDVFTWRDGDLAFYVLGLQKDGAAPKLTSLERALRAALDQASADGVGRVLLPRLGGGKTGLDWTRAKRVIAEVAAERPIDVVVFEQFVRKAEPPPEGDRSE